MAYVSKETEKQRINIYLPVSLVNRVDEEAKALGVSRQAMIALNLTQFYDNKDATVAMNKGINLLTGMSPDDFFREIMYKAALGEK